MRRIPTLGCAPPFCLGEKRTSPRSVAIKYRMTLPGYPAAKTAAKLVHPHFVDAVAASGRNGSGPVAVVPDPGTIQAIIDVAFWGSLRREEGYAPRISLAFVGPEQVVRSMRFERPLPLQPHSLTRIAPAVERPGIHLGVWPEGEELCVWGATRDLPASSFVLETIAPGLLVVKTSRGEGSGKFVNVAVLEGDQVKVIDQQAATVPDCPALLISLLGLESQFNSSDGVSVLIQLAVSMRLHGRGGSLLVVPSNSDLWRESMLHPMLYSVVPPFSMLAELMSNPHESGQRQRWRDAVRRTVDGIAGLTTVDGATVITDRYELLAFGAKIVRRPKFEQVSRLIVTEPIEGATPAIIEPSLLGGTRHLSAAQFAHDQRNAIAMVASQDGRFTVFAWSPCEQMVHAHRIEAMLL